LACRATTRPEAPGDSTTTDPQPHPSRAGFTDLDQLHVVTIAAKALRHHLLGLSGIEIEEKMPPLGHLL
jgi:hypothetical protein